MATNALFKYIEEQQAERPWDRVLDAGSGEHSLRWVRSLDTTGWTAVTVDATRTKRMLPKWEPLMRSSDQIVLGSWTDPDFLKGEQFDVVLLDYLIGAIDAFAPYFQNQIFARLRPHVKDTLYCGVRVPPMPWVKGKHRLTEAYAWFLADWAKRLSWQEIAVAFRTTWDHVFCSVERAVTWGRKHQDLSGIEAIGIDEIAWQRGHRYLTLVYQIDGHRKRLLWIGEKRTIKTLLIGLEPFPDRPTEPAQQLIVELAKTLYMIGLEPFPDRPTEPAQQLIVELAKTINACRLLAGERAYREFPASWAEYQLQQSGYVVEKTRHFGIIFRARYVNSQVQGCFRAIDRLKEPEIARAMRGRVERIRDQLVPFTNARQGIRLGSDYIITARLAPGVDTQPETTS